MQDVPTATAGPFRLAELRLTEVSLCRHGINPEARVVLVKAADRAPPVQAPPEPADPRALALAEREAELGRLEGLAEERRLLAKAAAWAPLGLDPLAYARHAGGIDADARDWLDRVLSAAAAAVAEAGLYGERGHDRAAGAEEPAIVRRARRLNDRADRARR